MRFLIDECLHTSLTEVANAKGHEAHHVVWLGLAAEKDWDLMPHVLEGDFTFVTNNARDFRRLFAGAQLHAGLVIIVPQVAPATQRAIFGAVLTEIQATGDALVNEAIEVKLEGGEVVFDRYDLPR